MSAPTSTASPPCRSASAPLSTCFFSTPEKKRVRAALPELEPKRLGYEERPNLEPIEEYLEPIEEYLEPIEE
jgi:hypothetical protein